MFTPFEVIRLPTGCEWQQQTGLQPEWNKKEKKKDRLVSVSLGTLQSLPLLWMSISWPAPQTLQLPDRDSHRTLQWSMTFDWTFRSLTHRETYSNIPYLTL